MGEKQVSGIDSDKDGLVFKGQVEGYYKNSTELWMVFNLLEVRICFQYSENRVSECVLIAVLISFSSVGRFGMGEV